MCVLTLGGGVGMEEDSRGGRSGGIGGQWIEVAGA